MFGQFVKIITQENDQVVERVVNVLNPDHIAWEKYARAHNIDQQAAPMLGATYRAFAALRRTSELSCSFDAYEQTVLEIIPCNANGVALELKDGQLIDPEAQGADEADPTP